MPEGFGLLRPQPVLGGLAALPGLDSLRPRADIAPYMPDLGQVQQSYEEQQAEKPWWVKLLEIPDRVFGGQMIKGFLAGTGEAGAADNIIEGIRKNPVFQLLDIVNPFGDPLTGRTTSFSDVRKAMDLNFGQANVDTGAANFFLNLAGEILLDPSSFLLPFGAVAKGLKPGAGLAQAVMNGQRAMTVFAVPFVEGRYAPQPFKALDIKIAQQLEKWADFLNTNAVTKPLLQAFSKTSIGIRGSANRAFVIGASELAGEKATLRSKPLLERLHKIGYENPEMLRDGSFQRFIYAAREYGISGTDDIANAPDIIMGLGREVAKARHRYKRLMRDDQGFRDLVQRAEAGDIHAGDVLYYSYPDVQLPTHILEANNLAKRPGVEFRRPTPQLTVERNVQGVVAPGTDGTFARAAAEPEVAGLSAKVIAEGEQRVVDLFASISKRSPDLQKSLIDVSNDLGDILDDLGMSDVMSGFLNGMNELYMPRMISPEVRKTVTEMWLGSVHKQFGNDARRFAEGFMKERGALDQLDTLTANYLIEKLGTKFTGNRPLKEFSESYAAGVMATEARILDPIMPGIRKLDPDAAQFFGTNPFLNTFKRIEQSTKLHEKAYLNAALLGADSPLVYKRDTVMQARADLAQATANPGSRPDLITPETGKLRRLLLVNPNGNLLDQARFGGPVDVASAWHHTMKDDMIGRKMIGRRALRDELHRKMLDGEMRFDAAIDQLSTASKLTDADDLTIATTDLGKVTAYKRLLANRKRLAKGTTDPETVLWYDERLGEIKAEMLEEMDELRQARTDYLSAAKAETKEKTALLRDVLSRRLTPEETREMLRLRELEKGRGILPLDELMELEPEAAQRLMDRFKDSEAVWVDDDVYQGLWGKNGYLEKLRRPDLLAGRFGIKYLDGMQTWFKAWTLMPPVFMQTWTRDFVSGHILQAMGGDITPWAMVGAQKDATALARALKAGMRGDMTALDKISVSRTLADGTPEILTGRQMYDAMAGKGAVGGSWWKDEMMMAGEEAAQLAGSEKGTWSKLLTGTLPPLVGSKWNKGLAGNPLHNPIIRTGIGWRTFLDDQVRATGVIARWKSGQTLDDAIKNTMSLSYDPRKGLTSFERSVARRVLPFYGWTKFAVSKMTDLYFTKPGAVTFWEKLYDSARKARLEHTTPEQFEAVMPEFLKDNFGVPYRDTPDGPMFFALGNYIPVGEITRLVNALEDGFSGRANQTLAYAMERFDPFARSAIEQVFNYSFYNQREIESFPGEHTEMFGITMPKRTANIIKSVRFLNEIDRLNLVSFQDFDGIRLAAGDATDRGTRAGSKKQAPWWERLLTGAFGPGPRGYLVDVAEETRFKAAQQERELSVLKGKLRQRLEEPGKPAKQADVEEIQKLIADLMAHQQQREEVQQSYKVPLLRR